MVHRLKLILNVIFIILFQQRILLLASVIYSLLSPSRIKKIRIVKTIAKIIYSIFICFYFFYLILFFRLLKKQTLESYEKHPLKIHSAHTRNKGCEQAHCTQYSRDRNQLLCRQRHTNLLSKQFTEHNFETQRFQIFSFHAVLACDDSRAARGASHTRTRTAHQTESRVPFRSCGECTVTANAGAHSKGDKPLASLS